jgi:hypothetical protein
MSMTPLSQNPAVWWTLPSQNSTPLSQTAVSLTPLSQIYYNLHKVSNVIDIAESKLTDVTDTEETAESILKAYQTKSRKL